MTTATGGVGEDGGREDGGKGVLHGSDVLSPSVGVLMGSTLDEDGFRSSGGRARIIAR